MKIKKYFSKYKKQLISILMVFAFFLSSTFALPAHALTVPVTPNAPLYFAETIDDIYNGAFWDKPVWASEVTSQGRITTGTGFVNPFLAYVANFGIDLGVDEYETESAAGYYNIHFRVSSKHYNFNAPKSVSFAMSSHQPGFGTATYSFNRIERETPYWVSYYADNVYISDFVGQTPTGLFLFLQWDGMTTWDETGLQEMWVVSFERSPNPIDVVLPEEPPPPQEEETFPDNYEDETINDTQNIESELIESQKGSLGSALDMMTSAENSLVSLASAFALVGSIFNGFTSDLPLSTLVVFSISLGIFGYLLNAFVSIDRSHRQAKARADRQQKSSGKGKKGG